MEGRAKIEEAKRLFGRNFIGAEEIRCMAPELGLQLPEEIPELPYTLSEMESRAGNCILILGAGRMHNGSRLTLLALRERFGTDPAAFEPCFYNQDWYLKENFMQTGLENKWYLIDKEVHDGSRAVVPAILEKKLNLRV